MRTIEELIEEKTTALLVGSYIDAYFSNEMDEFTKNNPEIFNARTGELKSDYKKCEDIISFIKEDEIETLSKKSESDGLTKAEYSILLMMSMSKDAKDLYQRDLGYLLDPINQKLAMLIIDEYRKNGECRLSKLLDEVDDDNVKNVEFPLFVFTAHL